MAGNLSVYKQMTVGVKECLDVMKREIGMKSTCKPFAVKVIEALSTLDVQTEQGALYAANVLLSGLQTLFQGGICAEDYDKIDLVKRGKAIVASARVEAFYRAAARKGYRITDTIIPVPNEDADTTYFKENFAGNDIVYTLEDRRINPDREVTAKRLVTKYFSKFLCRLDVHEVKTNKRVTMTICEISIDDLLKIASASEQGLYKSEWKKVIDPKTKKEKNQKIISNELNPDSFWGKWTGEMVNKTVIRRALKRIKEVLPELTETIYAFEQDDYVDLPEEKADEPTFVPEVPVKAEDVDLNKLNAEQIEECEELFALYCKNPKLAEDKFLEIKQRIDEGESIPSILNKEYAALSCLKQSKEKWAQIGGLFE